MINTSLSCVPPLVQWAGQAALEHDAPSATRTWSGSAARSSCCATAWRRIDGVQVLLPAGTFYVFPDVRAICNRLGITLARPGDVPAGRGRRRRSASPAWAASASATPARGFLRFSCAEPDERIDDAMKFLPVPWNGRIESRATWTRIRNMCLIFRIN